MPNVSFCEDDRDIHYNPYVEPPFFCKLTLNDGSVVNIEGSGELTSTMTSAYNDTCVSAEIGELCTSIDESAFEAFYMMSSATIGNNVTTIGNMAFYGSNLSMSLIIGSGVTSIGDDAFYSSSLTSVTIPNSVTSIGAAAFAGCGGLTSVTIGSGVTSIGVGNFAECGLTSITVDSGNTVYDSRNNCNAIIEKSTNKLIAGCQTTVIPNSVTIIGDSAFSLCYGLTSLTIPSSVTSIEDFVFEGCSGLTSITIEATMPPTLGGSDVFIDASNCPIYVPSESVNTYKAAEYWSTYADRIQAIQ